MKTRILRKQLFNKPQRNIRSHKENRKVMSMPRPCVNKRLTRMSGNECIAGLRSHVMQEGNEGSPESALETCPDFAQMQAIKRTRQGNLE